MKKFIFLIFMLGCDFNFKFEFKSTPNDQVLSVKVLEFNPSSISLDNEKKVVLLKEFCIVEDEQGNKYKYLHRSPIGETIEVNVSNLESYSTDEKEPDKL